MSPPPTPEEIELRRTASHNAKVTWTDDDFWYHICRINDTQCSDRDKWIMIRKLIATETPATFPDHLRMVATQGAYEAKILLRYHLVPIEDVHTLMRKLDHKERPAWLSYCKSIGYYQVPVNTDAILSALEIKPEPAARIAERAEDTPAIKQLQVASEYGNNKDTVWAAIKTVLLNNDDKLWTEIYTHVYDIMDGCQNFDLVDYLCETTNLNDIRLAFRGGLCRNLGCKSRILARLPGGEQNLWLDYMGSSDDVLSEDDDDEDSDHSEAMSDD